MHVKKSSSLKGLSGSHDQPGFVLLLTAGVPDQVEVADQLCSDGRLSDTRMPCFGLNVMRLLWQKKMRPLRVLMVGGY